MFKNKNLVTKISNGILLAMFIVITLSGISILVSLLTNKVNIAGTSTNDYLYYAIMALIYSISLGVSIFFLNKKINFYKDEYPVSRQVFNLFVVLGVISNILSVFAIIVSYIIYKEFYLYNLLITFIEFGILMVSYKYVSKESILDTKNSKKNNVINLIIIFLLIQYTNGIIRAILQLIFKINETPTLVKYIIVYAVGICVVILSYILFNKNKNKNVLEVKEVVEVKVVKKTTKSKKGTNKSKKETKKK